MINFEEKYQKISEILLKQYITDVQNYETDYQQELFKKIHHQIQLQLTFSDISVWFSKKNCDDCL